LHQLVDRVQKQLANSPHSRCFESTIGGKIATEIIGASKAPSYKVRQEPFVSLGLEVKGNATLTEALEAFVEGERIELAGDGNVDRKVAILKRRSIAEAPPCIVLDLNCFTIDYETFSPVKVLDRLAFPMDLDLAPYCVNRLDIPEGYDGGDDLRKHLPFLSIRERLPGASGGNSSKEEDAKGSARREEDEKNAAVRKVEISEINHILMDQAKKQTKRDQDSELKANAKESKCQAGKLKGGAK